MTAAANALGMLAQYWGGANNAYRNATSTQLPGWTAGDLNFITVVGKDYHRVEFESGGTHRWVLTPDFYSVDEMMNDVRVHNYSDWLDNSGSAWREFWGNIRGWDE